MRSLLSYLALALVAMSFNATSVAFAETNSALIVTPSVRAFDTQYLDRETLTANTLESLLNERIRRVITAAGIHAGEFSSSVTVHVSKQIDPTSTKPEATPNSKKPKEPTSPETKKTQSDSPEFSSFQDHSLLSADDLVSRFESDELEKAKIDRKMAAENEQSLDDQDQDNDENQESFIYPVDSIYAQAALSEKLSAPVRAQVEQALHASLDPIYPGHIKVDVNSFAAYETPWYLKVLPWLQKLQYFAVAALFVLGAILFLVLSRLVPSWQARQALRTAHEQKEEKIEELRPDTEDTQEEPEEEEVVEETTPAPVEPPQVLFQPEAEDEAALAGKIDRTQKDIIAFLNHHPHVAPQVIAEWGVNEEPPSKISLCVELLSREGLDIGRVELRTDQFKALRDFKKRGEEISLKERLRLYNEMFWDFASAQHLAQETEPMPFEFLNITDDRILFEAIQNEDPRVKAQIIASINEKRAAQILAKFPAQQKREIMECLFSGQKLGFADILPVAERVQEQVHVLMKSRSGMSKPGNEVLISILHTMDFSAQFNAAKGFLALDAKAREVVLSSFFNVGLLPLAKNSFLEQVFLDRSTENIRAIFSQFEQSFADRVRELLPPMQRRMLEGGNPEPVSLGMAMSALKEVNELVLGRLARKEIVLQDIFENEGGNSSENAFGARADNELKAA